MKQDFIFLLIMDGIRIISITLIAASLDACLVWLEIIVLVVITCSIISIVFKMCYAEKCIYVQQIIIALQRHPFQFDVHQSLFFIYI